MVIPESLLAELSTLPYFDKAGFIAAQHQAPVTSIRLHPVKKSDVFQSNEEVKWCPSGRYLPTRPVFTLDPLFHAGAYYVQEASSMFLEHILKQILSEMQQSVRVLDLCAAPGGKSTLIASLLSAESLLICNEVIRTRASILEENIVKWGYSNTWVSSNDPRDFKKIPGYFDIIVVDAPCSGSGLFRKDENAIKEWSENNVHLCSERQKRILSDVWSSLKEDGIFIYATCSFSPQEDEGILDWLADEYEVESVDIETENTWDIVKVHSPQNNIFGYRFFPDKLKGEGFFIAAVKKRGQESEPKLKGSFWKNDATLYPSVQKLLIEAEYSIIPVNDENYSAIHPAHFIDWQFLHKLLFLRKVGVELGFPTAKEWVPSHQLALSLERNSDLRTLDVTKEQALKFLKKEEMPLEINDKGWYIVSYQGLGLGWVKALGNRINNYLPKHWRIRMDITDEL
jgi:16S rRNA C967 or C1407 C5-methylase (RsmB/RsmF family)/NOL1/NOP2/fmu family ribosome biogenesis protein